MPRFFFNYLAGNHIEADSEGVELPHLEAASHEAAHALADWLREDAHLAPKAIEVQDSDGPVLLVNFSFELKRPT